MHRVEIPVTWDMHERFESKLEPGPPSPDESLAPGPCWGWSGGYFSKTGYARFNVRYADGRWRPTTAHRIAWRLYRGEFDPQLEPDHLCRNRACVNPWHGDPVTRAVNMARGMHPTAILVRENRCAQGHELTEANTIRRKNGKRECRICSQARDRARNQSGGRKEHYRKMYQQRKQRAKGVVSP
jgi:hypothetical protein